MQLLLVSAMLVAWLCLPNPTQNARLLLICRNSCLVLACVALLTSATHMTHLSAALLLAAANATARTNGTGEAVKADNSPSPRPRDRVAITESHPQETAAQTSLRWLLALAYAFAGYMHLKSPAGFIAITPSWVPEPALVIWATGLCEIAGAIGLLVPPTLLAWPRAAAGIGLALYAVCVWPANANHALNDIAVGGVRLPWWYHAPRLLLLQPLLIWAALWVGGIVTWPLRRKAE